MSCDNTVRQAYCGEATELDSLVIKTAEKVPLLLTRERTDIEPSNAGRNGIE